MDGVNPGHLLTLITFSYFSLFSIPSTGIAAHNHLLLQSWGNVMSSSGLVEN